MSRIRADKLVNRAGSGGPHLPNGVASGFSVVGVVTATEFRKSDGTEIGGTAAIAGINTAGVSTFTDVVVNGNLDVNGTTTTIDTTITEVDSLSVDGAVTAASFSGTLNSSDLTGALPAIDGSALTGIESWNQFDTWLYSP